jgi:hypothetical protein
MHDLGGFGFGDFLPRPFDIVSWCIIEIERNTLKRLLPPTVADISFDVMQNKYTKEICIVPHPGRQNKKTVNAGRRPNNANQEFLGMDCLCFSRWKSGP